MRTSLESASSLAPCRATVRDVSGGCGASFAITAVSDAFVGVRALARHRLVHEALGGEQFMKDVHAVEMKCYTVAQAAEREAKEKEKEGAGGGEGADGEK